jgi:ABC-2 type transport system permease protein
MATQQWATRVEPIGADMIRIDATSIEAGERGIPAVIAAVGAGQVSCEPAAADLESAFLALTGPQRPRSEVTSTVQPTGRGGPMNLWRLEWLRLTRTPRALALGAVFTFFGLLEPVVTRYQSQIFRDLGNGVRISFPPATPAAGISSYLGGIGLVVVVVIAAGAFTFDAHHGLATFLRTRVASIWQLVAPRFAVNAAAAAIAYLLGTLAAWYEMDLLIGPLPVAAMVAGILCGAAYLAFAVALTALAASIAPGTLATVGITLVVMLLLPVAGTLRRIDNWLPSTLATAPVDLLNGAHHLSHYLPAFAVTVTVGVAALAIAVLRLRTREI